VCAHLWRADACAQGVPVARTAGGPYVYGSNGDSQDYARVQGTKRRQGTHQWSAGRRPRSWRQKARLRSRSADSTRSKSHAMSMFAVLANTKNQTRPPVPSHTHTHTHTHQFSSLWKFCCDSYSFYLTIHCNALNHIITHYNTLQHTATHCNTLQHTWSIFIL